MEKAKKVKKIKCAICGQLFTPHRFNSKYCGAECREEGRIKQRHIWEQTSGYLERQREHMRAVHSGQYAKEKAEREAEEKKRRAAEKRKLSVQANKAKKELISKAEQGDGAALMILEVREHGNTSPEYWEAFKKYDIDYNARNGTTSTTTVNGISVHDEFFGLAVSMSIDEVKGVCIRSGAEIGEDHEESEV